MWVTELCEVQMKTFKIMRNCKIGVEGGHFKIKLQL